MKAIAIALMLCLVGCGGSSGSVDSISAKVADWQAREALCEDIEGPFLDEGYALEQTLDVIGFWLWSNGVEFAPDIDDYWKTSCETITDKNGDCEDLAAVAHRLLTQEGIESEMLFLSKAEGCHMVIFCDPWILDRYFVEDAQEYFEVTGYQIVYSYSMGAGS